MQGFVRHAVDQGAAVVVHQGFGQAGGAARIHNPQRVVERHPLRLKRVDGRVLALHDRAPIGAVSQRWHAAQVLIQHHMGHTGQGRSQFMDHADALVVFAAIRDPVHTDQYLGRDLLEAVDHRVGAHVGRAYAPNAPDAHHRQKRHHGLGDVGQVSRHPVAGLHTLGLQVQRQGCDLAFQCRPGHLATLASLVVADDGGHARCVGRVHMAQHLLGVVHLRADKPSRARHHIALEHHAVRGGRLQVKVVPNRLPKIVEVGDRPLPHGLVIVEMQVTVLGQPLLVQADLRHKGGLGGDSVHGERGYQSSCPLRLGIAPKMRA
jgi:hypothetical protein